MGFPRGYVEIAVPWPLLCALILLSYALRPFFWVLTAVGLGDLVDADMLQERLPEHQQNHDSSQFHTFRSSSAALVHEALPTMRYAELIGQEAWRVGGCCAVCLHEFEAREEVRRLSNCRHVFHRACLDRWVEHDRLTCPLCRMPLVPEEMWAYSTGILDVY